MPYKRIYIWVEGSDDERFIKNIIKPLLVLRYDYVHIVQYCRKKPKWRVKFLESIKSMNADYLFFTDINSTPCVVLRKNEVKRKHSNIDIDKIRVVIKEIEGWYLSGLSNIATEELGLDKILNTDNLTKEDFNNLIPSRFDSRIDFMMEIIKRFSIENAKKNNESFRYLISKDL